MLTLISKVIPKDNSDATYQPQDQIHCLFHRNLIAPRNELYMYAEHLCCQGDGLAEKRAIDVCWGLESFLVLGEDEILDLVLGKFRVRERDICELEREIIVDVIKVS